MASLIIPEWLCRARLQGGVVNTFGSTKWDGLVCRTLSTLHRSLPLAVDLVLYSEGVYNNSASPGVFFCALFFVVLMILYFNRGVPDLSRFMVDFQSLFEVV